MSHLQRVRASVEARPRSGETTSQRNRYLSVHALEKLPFPGFTSQNVADMDRPSQDLLTIFDIVHRNRPDDQVSHVKILVDARFFSEGQGLGNRRRAYLFDALCDLDDQLHEPAN